MVLHVLPLLDHKKLLPPPSPHDPPADGTLDGYVLNSRFLFATKIGAGSFGLIYLVRDLATGARYAAKIVLAEPSPTPRPRGTDAKAHVQDRICQYFAGHRLLQARVLNLQAVEREGANIAAVREIALQLKVRQHPNVATIHHVLVLGEHAVVTLMDYFPQGDLFQSIIDRRVFLAPPAHQDRQLLMKNCMLQLIDVVHFCAQKSVFHCDLKPENVMVFYDPAYRRPAGSKAVDYAELQVFLIDFGLAMSSGLICCNVCRGSSFYMAPERIVNYNTCGLVKSLIDMEEFATDGLAHAELASKLFPTLAGDVWSLGVLFVNITCSKNPWPIANINDRQEVFHNYIVNDSSLLRSILPILRQFNQVLNEIFVLNPARRIGLPKLAQRILACDFFDDPALFNEQLYTPPAEYSPLATEPVSVCTEMGLSKASLHTFGCPTHG
ncbi:kinase-like protein [Metschnikowia bicuspidata var. bicuspidata NRRL YB-4993]|uniref:Kinase-like protein n=1 Tax=Metschnikowia bicuspidata var. bicuspidata NRRL YB-4993 TaxID=869754 RepID=A0A1A0HA40_9ASCO|nr:kinase-like protein [Metschnikowia bicuspidata var. bicuspidata NRRL YB-4993]OBA20881.1 kinase-like protein [Metschnikowia bicuspidata var. bicuspidata NRRL YB-4993]